MDEKTITEMDDKILAALKESIAHWERVVESEDELIGPEHCALCKMFIRKRTPYDSTCVGCPIYGRTNRKRCYDTPYTEYDVFVHGRFLESEADYDTSEDYDDDAEAREARRRELAQAELDFLRSLLPIVCG